MTFDPTSLLQRLYLAGAIRCYIKHGPGNYPPEYVYRNPVETKPPAIDEQEPTNLKTPMGYVPRTE